MKLSFIFLMLLSSNLAAQKNYEPEKILTKDTIFMLDLLSAKKANYERNVYWDHHDEFGIELQICDRQTCNDCGDCKYLTLNLPAKENLSTGLPIELKGNNVNAEYRVKQAFGENRVGRDFISGSVTPLSLDSNKMEFLFHISILEENTKTLLTFYGTRTLSIDR